ncbi:MAG: hypothetical protein J6A28_02495 [Clostridia bacterium]|nr:hypothetical protein [Clostridia bacterium]
METAEIQFEIAKNQIGIDFDALEKEEEIEESSILPNTLIKPVNHDWIANEVLFVVVRTNRKDVCPNFASLKLCGKTMTEWVLMAGGQCQSMVIEQCEDVMSKIRSIGTDKQIIAVFYSDAPLLDRAGFYRIMDYFSSRSINFLQLARGFIVKTNFLRNNPNFMSGSVGGYEDESLLVAEDGKTLNYIQKHLNKKILNYHIANGVVVFGENTVFIDADCEIDSGVVIYPNNVIEGQSIISSGCVLKSGNVINNSILSQNCIVEGAYIENSKLGQGTVVGANEKIVNQEV